MKALVPDGEFVELWAKYKSVARLSEILGCSARAVNTRRRALEQRHNLQLNAGDHRGEKYSYKTIDHRPARQHFKVTDGKVIIFSDAHFWPDIRSTAFKGLLKGIRDMKPKAVVCGGDSFDGARISRFPRIGWDATPTVKDELQACVDRHKEIEDAAGDVFLPWVCGNHDGRAESRLAQMVPEFEGVKGFSLKDHFPKWIPCWSVWINNQVVIKHRDKGGVHATHQNAVNSGKTEVTGHLHSLKVTPFTDYNGIRWGVDTGTLADPNGPQFVHYSEDSAKNHRSGFAVLTFHKGELLWPELVYVRKEGEVEFRGTVFDVSGE